ncbi:MULTISPECIES: proline dehydrogenase family protein [unclassified Roseitalea]|uniref:proline dehydrogenase family protein n=1 Tax=unclassified Roseitalea TaxID=2639107 RepID=UPI00273EA9ED|nr:MULTISPECIES: proline dehydrogenase family protein [unclassified Roseitalea]
MIAPSGHPDFDAHAVVCFLHDAKTSARAIVALHRVDPTGTYPSVGGCRMRDYATTEEALGDTSVTQVTIALHDTLQGAGLPVALTLQAYRRRTWDDMVRQVERGSRIRLVKGAFAAGPDLAFQTQREIKSNSRHLIDLMLSPEARERGFYPVVATHDTALHEHAIAAVRRNGWEQGTYEFEMLLGVREDVARDLAARGERVRLYVPFGRDWWPHAVRRIGENPRNAVLLARSLVT